MAKSQLPNPMMPSSQPAKSAPVPDSRQDQTTKQPVTNGTGHETQTAVSATELWWRTFTLNSRDQSSDRKSTRLNSSHVAISYAVFCLLKNKRTYTTELSY